MANWSKKIGYSFLIVALGFLLIFLVGNWQIGKIKKSLPLNLQKELESMPFEEIQKKFFGETTEYKEFISPDGNLKVRYLADWLEMNKEIVESFNQEIIKKGAKVLFFAQKIKVKGGAFASLMIQELDKKDWQSLEEIIEETKKEIEERGEKMEVVRVNLEEGVFEAKYKKESQLELHSLEKILIGKEKDYLIVFLTFDKDWGGFIDEANAIFNSAELIP